MHTINKLGCFSAYGRLFQAQMKACRGGNQAPAEPTGRAGRQHFCTALPTAGKLLPLLSEVTPSGLLQVFPSAVSRAVKQHWLALLMD